MPSKSSPFSPMEKRQSSSEEEVSADPPGAEEEEKEPEGKQERKARLVPKKGNEEHGHVDRRRSRSRRSRSRDRRGRSDRKEKKEKERKRKRRSEASRDRRGAQAPPSPRGPPPPKPAVQSPQAKKEHADGGKGAGKNLKGGPKKQMCKLCGSRVAGTASALDQHQWLSEYCLAWQAYTRG